MEKAAGPWMTDYYAPAATGQNVFAHGRRWFRWLWVWYLWTSRLRSVWHTTIIAAVTTVLPSAKCRVSG